MDLDARFAQDLRGHTATTERLGAKFAIVAKKEVAGLEEARRMRTSTETQEESSSPAISIWNSRAGREFESPGTPTPWVLRGMGLNLCRRPGPPP